MIAQAAGSLRDTAAPSVSRILALVSHQRLPEGFVHLSGEAEVIFEVPEIVPGPLRRCPRIRARREHVGDRVAVEAEAVHRILDEGRLLVSSNLLHRLFGGDHRTADDETRTDAARDAPRGLAATWSWRQRDRIRNRRRTRLCDLISAELPGADHRQRRADQVVAP